MVKKWQACSLEGTDDGMNEVWNENIFWMIFSTYLYSVRVLRFGIGNTMWYSIPIHGGHNVKDYWATSNIEIFHPSQR